MNRLMSLWLMRKGNLRQPASQMAAVAQAQPPTEFVNNQQLLKRGRHQEKVGWVIKFTFAAAVFLMLELAAELCAFEDLKSFWQAYLVKEEKQIYMGAFKAVRGVRGVSRQELPSSEDKRTR
ncbi:hypothetical protein DAPPUDRAFT_315501 [Daphnia pulex]|uniref:Uncharacterized protein n=1 Tax=Daphnia pulex TaxID=6669 RepID=E9G9X7_DAPPU|nr:hypothetical protein DAPPUDRAFT_315501 [Daphnia pulex]|eukprot:EFX83642.1 hypothetical protein DAPPUDRAFT_315501 [Daphnia pulex]